MGQYRMKLHFVIIFQILFVSQFLLSSSLEKNNLVNVRDPSSPEIYIQENNQEVLEQTERAMLIDMMKNLMRQTLIGRIARELVGGQLQSQTDDRINYWDDYKIANDIYFAWRRPDQLSKLMRYPESRPKKEERNSRIRIM